jgi:predicted TIM-barrel fold metal-dependent hydrolase
MPLPADVQICSVDDHVIEHRDAFKDRLPAKFGDRGPKIVDVKGPTTDPLGNVHEGDQQVWEIDGVRYPTIGLNAVAGKPKEEIGLDPVRFDEMRPGCYDIHERVKDMDEDGIQAQLCFPSLPGFAGSSFVAIEDKDLAHACIQGWNDFAIDEWCATYPDRQIPLAIVPYWDAELSTAEVERVAAKGAKAVSFNEMPHSAGLPSWHTDHWDGMLSALEDADMPLCLHFGSGGAPNVSPGANFAVAIALFGTNSLFTMTELLLSPIFHNHPRLRVALSEGGIGWMPWMLERIDYVWERHRHYTGCNPDVRPSELFKEHIFGCFISDDTGVEIRDLIGVDNIMFESDYPHSDSNWPSSRVVLEKMLANVPDDIARKIAEDNARRVFNFPRSS